MKKPSREPARQPIRVLTRPQLDRVIGGVREPAVPSLHVTVDMQNDVNPQ